MCTIHAYKMRVLHIQFETKWIYSYLMSVHIIHSRTLSIDYNTLPETFSNPQIRESRHVWTGSWLSSGLRFWEELIHLMPSLQILVNSLFDFHWSFHLSLDERQICTWVGELFARASQIPSPLAQIKCVMDSSTSQSWASAKLNSLPFKCFQNSTFWLSQSWYAQGGRFLHCTVLGGPFS